MPTWTTQDGEQMDMKDMKDSHVLNTLRYMARYPRWRANKQLPLLKEAQRRSLKVTGIELSDACTIHFCSRPCEECQTQHQRALDAHRAQLRQPYEMDR